MTTATTTSLDEAARRALPNTVQAAARVLERADTPVRGAFLARALNALAEAAAEMDEVSLGDAAGARSDYEALLQMLDRPEVIEALRVHDPLLPAKLRGLRMKQQLLEAEGGTISAEQAGALLGITRQAVDKRRRAGHLIGLPTGRRGYAYPLWQFDPDGRGTLPGLEEVLCDLRNHDPLMQVIFMLTPDLRLDSETPLTELRQGHVEAVRRAAQTYGEQGAA